MKMLKDIGKLLIVSAIVLLAALIIVHAISIS